MTQIVQNLENVFMGLTFFFLILYGIATLAETKPNWFLSKTFIKAKKMEQRYDKAVQTRKDMIHHYYWSRQSKNNEQMKNQEKEILKIDKQLEQIRGEYELVRKGLPVPLKMF